MGKNKFYKIFFQKKKYIRIISLKKIDYIFLKIYYNIHFIK
jgi:hypothetical protein